MEASLVCSTTAPLEKSPACIAGRRGRSFSSSRLNRPGAFLALLVALMACQPKALLTPRPLTDEGRLIVYLQPLEQEARRLEFTLVGVAALGGHQNTPLGLSMSEIDTKDLTRQRLLANGRLPAGDYSGLSIEVAAASLYGEWGKTELGTPEQAVHVSFPLRVEKRRATVIWLFLDPADSIREGFQFVPAMTIALPAKPVLSLIGYATNTGSNYVTVFDKRSGQALDAIATGSAPMDVEIDPTARLAYVALAGEDSAIEVVDVMKGAVVSRIRLTAGDEPRELALSRDGRTLISANTGSDSVSFIDTVSLSEQARVEVGDGPSYVLLGPGDRRAYVLNTLSHSISVLDVEAVLDAENEPIVATISTEQGPTRADFSRDGERLYVIHDWSPYIIAIDTASLTVSERAYIGMGLTNVKVDPRTDLIYLSVLGDRMVQEADPFALIATPAMEVDGTVGNMTIDDEENNLYLVMPETGTLAAFNLTTGKLLSSIDLGTDPYAVAVVGQR